MARAMKKSMKSASAPKPQTKAIVKAQTSDELFAPRPSGKKARSKKTGTQKSAVAETSEALMAPRVQKSQDRLYGEIAIEENRLERFPNRTHVRRYTIEFTCPEFTCLCPRSGFPDFATVKIKYVPDQYCVELKSLKLYINGFRNKKVFHEDVTNVIIQDMIDLLDPHQIEVIGDFTVRGNIHTVITANHTKEA